MSLLRLNATRRPSGEKVGSASPLPGGVDYVPRDDGAVAAVRRGDEQIRVEAQQGRRARRGRDRRGRELPQQFERRDATPVRRHLCDERRATAR
jgi:hypothetical protein